MATLTDSRDPSDLCPCVRAKLERVLLECRHAGIPVTLISTLRSIEQQRRNVAAGVSWTMRSKHLPQPPNGKSLAFDLAPREYLDKKGWNPTGPVWDDIDVMCDTVGLKTGVFRNGKNIDRPHHYLDACQCSA